MNTDSKVTKETLLKYVDEIGSNTKFWNKTNRKLGSTNIRGVATTATNAECFKELELYIQFKGSKQNTGWDTEFKDKKNFAKVIIEYMNKIYKESEDEKTALRNISLFFGYLFWKKKALEN